MAINTFTKRFLLRRDLLFDNIVEEVAIEHARHIRDVEAEDAPYHAERVAMATKVLAGDRQDPILCEFYRELKDRAVRADAFLSAAFAGGLTNAEGVPVPQASEISDTMLRNGVAGEWNATALVAWPDIVADVATEGGA